MPSLNVYLPRDLADEVAAAKDRLNASAVCQRALREELRKLPKETAEIERIEVEVDETTWGTTRKLAFMGRWLVPPRDADADDGCLFGVALTRKGKLAVWFVGDVSEASHFSTFDSFEELEAVGYPEYVVADTRQALTGEWWPVTELDI